MGFKNESITSQSKSNASYEPSPEYANSMSLGGIKPMYLFAVAYKNRYLANITDDATKLLQEALHK